jgi:Abnormal spindle-like microcephaly-assoc'd, ASPM-SPD-2-Hydin
LYGNVANQIAVVGQAGGILINNWETGAAYLTLTRNLTSERNILYGTQPNVFSDYLGGADWTAFVNTLNSNTNTYYAGSSATTNAFSIAAPRAGTVVDFSTWKSTTGQDASSTWASATPPSSCAVAAKSPDFWLASSSYAGATVDFSGHAYFNVQAFALGGLTGNIVLGSDGVSSIPGLTASFSPATISPTGSSVFTVAAKSSTAPGTYPITILGNLGSVTRTMTLSLVVLKTGVRLSAASLTFPGQKVDTTSAAQNITLTNNGLAPLAIASVSASQNYAESNTCGLSVKAGGSCTISVTFTPRAAAQLNGTLTIKDSDVTTNQVVGLSGTGIGEAKISVSPPSVYFGGHIVGTTSSKVVTLKNNGTATLTISKIAISGTDSADFKFTSTCGASLTVGASCSVTVTFTPEAKGVRSATLSIYDNDGYQSSPQADSLTGTGT